MREETKKAIIDLVGKESWFSYDKDDDQEDLLFATRDNGSVGDEEPGIEDIREGQRIGKVIKARFWDEVDVEVEIVDEWVHLNITPKQ